MAGGPVFFVSGAELQQISDFSLDDIDELRTARRRDSHAGMTRAPSTRGLLQIVVRTVDGWQPRRGRQHFLRARLPRRRW